MKVKDKQCAADLCDQNAFVQSSGEPLCARHYQRWRAHGHWSVDKRRGSQNVNWKDDVSYAAMHARVRAQFGSAGKYPCVLCPGWAVQWAYDGTDPSQRLGTNGYGSLSWFSIWPEFYMPVCLGCHMRLDRSRASDELREYREWKARTGLTLKDLDV